MSPSNASSATAAEKGRYASAGIPWYREVILAGEWTPSDENGIYIDFPFPITIPWTELEY
ncbi:hypothetical protein [Nocardia carnea]|uniref:hypothetical protein n=1 Tax=Nocardia carnea TaxID=37328 RepID=UPI0024543650|nr:hypothetical protein [Nocardia carnea]